MPNTEANFTRNDYLIMEMGPRVVWCWFCENTGLSEIRRLTIRSRFKYRVD